MIKKFVLWTLVVLALAYAAFHLYTDSLMRAGAAVPVGGPLPAGDAVAGKRLAAIAGCTSCHEPGLGGAEFIHIPNVARLVAPDLTRARARYDDAAFLRLFRSGAKADGRYALGMPGGMQQRMTDQEVADLIAYVRSVPLAATPATDHTRIYPLGRLGLLLGQYHAYEGDAPESAGVLRDRAEPSRGRHLALIACTECHGLHFEGGEEMGAPPLAIAKAYTLAQFTRLMRTGTTLAGTDSKTGLMSGVARRRFVVLTDAEIADLHAFLSGPGAAPATASR